MNQFICNVSITQLNTVVAYKLKPEERPEKVVSEAEATDLLKK